MVRIVNHSQSKNQQDRVMKLPRNVQVGDVLLLGRHRLQVENIEGEGATFQYLNPEQGVTVRLHHVVEAVEVPTASTTANRGWGQDRVKGPN